MVASIKITIIRSLANTDSLPFNILQVNVAVQGDVGRKDGVISRPFQILDQLLKAVLGVDGVAAICVFGIRVFLRLLGLRLVVILVGLVLGARPSPP